MKTIKKYPKKYTNKLSSKDKKKQLKALNKSSKNYKKGKYYERPKMKSFKNKKSSWTQKFHKLYPEAKTLKQIEKVTGIPKKALMAVKKKGMGAYYSSGSRPNQTAESWGKARMYAYIFGSPTRKYDHHITKKYNVKFKFKPNYYPY
tara:strand:+ start:57 stop:497 length:441 start_codon:yes stop_codon:yes gene_type:complete